MDALCRWLLRLAGRLGGWAWRREGLPEWEGELWALRARGAGPWVRARFAFAAVLHALWLRRKAGGGVSGWGRDLGLAVRRLARAPGFTAVTVTVLALGIGANTALFSALDAAIRGSAPYPVVERLMVLDLTSREADSAAPPDTLPWSWPKFAFARERIRALDPLAAYAAWDLTLSRPGDPDRVGVEFVSSGYFDLLGRHPVEGRALLPADDPPVGAAVAVLGHALWTSRFGGDPSVIGRSVTVEGHTLEVVGVMPRGFAGLTGRGELWVPMSTASALLNPRLLESASLHWFSVIGRTKQGVSSAALEAELTGVGVGLAETFEAPTPGGAQGVAALPFLEARVNPMTRLALTAVFAGGLLLLAIACANVGSLLLARASARRADLAVRAALGAGWGRLVREQLLEGLTLSALGGALGIVLAWLAQAGVARAAGYALERSGGRSLQYLDPNALRVDASVLAVGMGLALATGLLSGLMPLRVVARPELSPDLRAGRRGVTRGRTRGEAARKVLVAAQLALTLVLVSGAGLMGASLSRLADVETGFTHDDVLTVRFERRAPATDEERRAFERALLDRVRALPGVRDVAIAPCPPLAGPCEVTSVRRVDDGDPVGLDPSRGFVTHAVSDDYFGTLGIPLREGRGFPPGLSAADAPVAVVNETAARLLFGGAATGHRVALTHTLTETESAEVIGVVADVRHGGIDEEARPAVYFSRRQSTPWYGTLLIRADGDPLAVLPAVRREAGALDPGLPLFEVTTLRALRAAATARTRVVLGLLAAFSGLGLLLSAVGIWGVVSHAIAQRTREMGLRLALGAPAHGLLGQVVGRSALLAAAGTLGGIGAAVTLTGRLRALLYGVEPGDARVMGAATLLLVVVVVTAAWLPARRVLRVDPARTLREE